MAAEIEKVIVHPDVGEGEVDFERCDDGNTDDYDACLNNCAQARCGDGIARTDLDADQRGFEACDDGNDDDSDNCLSNCVSPRCGDGIVSAGEGCDDGNEDPTDDCADCVPTTCGARVPF